MNEVEKMYKTIFGEFAPNCSLCVKLVKCEIINNTHNCNKFQCDYQRLFTAEKQIELTQKLWELRPNIYPNFDLLVNYSYGEMIANFVNNLWQDLTEEERKQIKNILESEVRE